MALNDYNVPLITAEDLRRWVPNFTETINEESQLNPCIIQAQQLDVAPAIGEALFLDLCENRSAEKYKRLMEGVKYTIDGRNYAFPGLAAALVWYTYARYILNKNAQDGPFGMQIKQSEYGDPVSDKNLQRISQQSRQNADAYLMRVHKYLTAKKSADYPLYLSDECSAENTPAGSFKITKIG